MSLMISMLKKSFIGLLCKNIVIFGADNISSRHTYNKKIIFE